MNVTVVGLGKMGLPVAAQCAHAGHTVAGLDVDVSVVDCVNGGRAPFHEPGLDAIIGAAVGTKRLRATTDAADAVTGAEVVVVIVPLGHADGRPDFTLLDSAVAAIGPHLAPGVLVSFETTLPVGSTRTRLTPALARSSGLVPGESLFVVFSPERVSSGTVFRDLRIYPKLVGGIDSASTARGVAFYESALEFEPRSDLVRPNGVWPLESAEAAELAKLAETTYRDLNIGFANELALASEGLGLDIRPIIEACNSQPYSHIHAPGAVAGHCIPVYPHLLMSSVAGFRIVEVARDVNASVPAHIVDAVSTALAGLRGRVVAVLGLAYRGGVREDAQSPCYPVVAAMRAEGATALVHDPLFDKAALESRGFAPYELGSRCDAAVVLTDHAEYAHLSSADIPAEFVYDLRRVLDPSRFAGITVASLGRPRR